MTLRELIHSLTSNQINWDYDVSFIDIKNNKEYKVTTVGVDESNHKILLNNIYDL